MRLSLQNCFGTFLLVGLVLKLTEAVLNANGRLGNSRCDDLAMSLQRVIKVAIFQAPLRAAGFAYIADLLRPVVLPYFEGSTG
jgi:hypothetical protein